MLPPTESRGPAPTTEDVFALLEHLLSGARLRLRTEAHPIVFELVPGHELWLFDPRSAGALFARTEAPAAGALRITCGAELLARLVTDESFVLGDDDTATFDGKIEDLLVLAEVLDESKNVLGIRAARSSQ